MKDGGTLVYSTCTLNPMENEENVTRFLSAHPEFAPEAIEIKKSKDIVRTDGMLTVFPDEFSGCDGFFVAKMKKVK